MRLDKYLKITRLIKRRTVANEACDGGRILVNGMVHGRISGTVHGILRATVDGDVDLTILSGAAEEEGKEAAPHEEE